MSRLAWGEIAFEAYRDESHGVCLVTGEDIPEWDKLPRDIKRAWEASARAVRQSAANLITTEGHGGDFEGAAVSSATLLRNTADAAGAISDSSGRNA